MQVWDGEQGTLVPVPRRLTNGEAPHVSLVYDYHFATWAEYHVTALKLDALVSCLVGRQQWEQVAMTLESWKILCIGDRCGLYGLCLLPQRMLPQRIAFKGFHITWKMA